MARKYNVVSLFSGCGGSSLGYKLAGFKVLLANEFMQSARDTYKANFPKTKIIDDDVRQVKASNILDLIKMKKGELDVLDGSPPCSAFSLAGKRARGWNHIKPYSEDKVQRTDDLYFEFIRLLGDIQPRVFVAENVASLTYGVARGYFLSIIEGMRKAGYVVKASILNSMYFNVAQARKRLFFIGIREDLSKKYNVFPSFPIPNNNYTTVFQAWQGLKQTKEEIDEAAKMGNSIKQMLSFVKSGKKASDTHPRKSYFSLARLDYYKPSPTVTVLAYNSLKEQSRRAALCHPTEDRYLTIKELSRICSYPDDFIFTGNFSQKWERMARSVPPNLMKEVANNVRVNILDRMKLGN
jgi:DNA (cytosine-5)-methyltransferase 1